MFKVEKPGIYFDVSEEDYRADCCPEPSLTQSLCKILIDQSPHHAWTASPTLNEAFEAEDDTKFDIGNTAHSIVLGRGKNIEVAPFDDWRKKEAKEFRENAGIEGKIAVLLHQFDQSTEMVHALWKQLGKHEDKNAFQDGHGEVMIAWQEEGVWFRSLIDWLHTDLLTVDDYKTTAMSVAPHVLGVRADNGGWPIQAAFIERGLDVLDPNNAGRRRFRFVAQENYEPFALNVMHMDEHWMTMGRKKVDHAVSMWRAALLSDKWHGYPNRGITPEYPGYSEKKWLEREIEHADRFALTDLSGG